MKNHYRLLFQLAVLIPLMQLGLQILGIRRVLNILNPLLNNNRGLPVHLNSPEYINRVRQSIKYIKKHSPCCGNCLSRSLILWCVLRRRGIDVVLRIGTCKKKGRFQAHAWVEYQGIPLNAGPKVRQRYATFEYAFGPDSFYTYKT